MSLDRKEDIYRELSQALEQLECPDGPLQSSLQTIVHILDETEAESQDELLVKGLKAITKHFALACEVAIGYAEAIANVLAEATKRQPLWRVLFGILAPQTDVPFENVLHVALQIRSFIDKGSLSLVRNSLRLIANCCADNNINRRFCLDHNALKDLLQLAIQHVELDFLIPTLYNICIDYENPDNEVIEEQNDIEHSENTAPSVSPAALSLLQASQSQCAAHEILLSITQSCSEDRKGYLAELVEMACVPFVLDTVHTVLTDGMIVSWSFTLEGCHQDTLDAMIVLAGSGSECLYHILRAMSLLLTNEGLCQKLFESSTDTIWKLVMLAAILDRKDDADHDDYVEELTESRKQFLKLFYQLTGMSTFISEARIHQALIDQSIAALSTSNVGLDQSGSQLLYTCSLIILAQLVASPSVKDQLLSNAHLIEILSGIVSSIDDNEILFPAVTLISRLCMTDRSELTIVQPKILLALSRLLAGKGRGLAIPFEALNALRSMIRNRPQNFQYFVENMGSEPTTVVAAVIELFIKTIEAGTKLETGHFFIDLLRTMFTQMKALDEESQAQMTLIELTFASFLDRHALQIADIFSWVCTQAEPKAQRIHGWFAMGMLSVWEQGRLAIVRVLEQDDFRDRLLEVSKTGGNPEAQNAKLVLSKLQQVPEATLSAPIIPILQTAANGLGMQLRFAS